ncbi:DUF3737 family protein [Leuconostoc falkenbergense]|uniref:DUF3737 family protein n=1 Tax=Leuconostoc falkenbergense TaxID=2766470 RepID=UPI0024AD1570|nr:DUF3737 family protein [Leuconostoc falkenbergense]MDI6666718.1 DUF3737 family protein [Leuconostoc falkenbergense]
MTFYQEQHFEGERPLFGEQHATIVRTTFGKGESPLKESTDIALEGVVFGWKYPLWYSQNIQVNHTIFEEMARSGIWYTNDIDIKNSEIQAPKLLRRCHNITLSHVHFSDAAETLWHCQSIELKNVNATGDYFGMDSQDIMIDHLNLIGNYAFDGAKNIEVHHSNFVTKDAFWNCENVTIYDSVLNGEYLAWNTKNLTLINCTIISDQGLCYIDNLTIKDCHLLDTYLSFEYSSHIDADIKGAISSIKNPISGRIKADSIGQIILDETKIDPSKINIDATKGLEGK